MVESLYLAAKLDKETAVADWLEQQLRQGTLTLSRLQQQFQPSPVPRLETLVVEQHSLSSYDRLLHHELSEHCQQNFTAPVKVPAAVPHEAAVAVP